MIIHVIIVTLTIVLSSSHCAQYILVISICKLVRAGSFVILRSWRLVLTVMLLATTSIWIVLKLFSSSVLMIEIRIRQG